MPALKDISFENLTETPIENINFDNLVAPIQQPKIEDISFEDLSQPADPDISQAAQQFPPLIDDLLFHSEDAELVQVIPQIDEGDNILQKIGQDIGVIFEASKIIIAQGPRKGEIVDRVKNIVTRAVSILAFVIPGVSRKDLIAELDAEAEEFTGFGPALVPAAGKIGSIATELFAFQQAFVPATAAINALTKIPAAQRLSTIVRGLGGVRQFADKFPRIARAIQLSTKSFGAGEIVGQTFGALESIDEDQGVLDTLRNMNKKGATFGAIASVFNLAQSGDRALYVNRLRRTMIKRFDFQLQQKVTELPRGVPVKTLESFKRAGLQQIDNIVSAAEGDLAQLTKGKVFGSQGKTNPHKDAELFMRQGFTLKGARTAQAGAVKNLKLGLGKSEPFIKLPTTRAGEIRETIKEVAKAIKISIKPAQQIRATQPLPPLKALVKPTEAQARQAALAKRGVKPEISPVARPEGEIVRPGPIVKPEKVAKPSVGKEVTAEKEVAAVTKGKQPWEMTIEEFVTGGWRQTFPGAVKVDTKTGKPAEDEMLRTVKISHSIAVENAVEAGGPVPLKVLEEYKGRKWADEAIKKLQARPAGESAEIAQETKAIFEELEKLLPAKPPVAKEVTAEKEVAAVAEGKEIKPTDQDLLSQRQDIKQIPPKRRKLQQIQRLNEIEDELVKRHADEFPEIDISAKSRTIEKKKVKDQILEHGIYQAEIEAIEAVPDLSGSFSVDSNEIQDIRARFEGRPEILRKFNVRKEGGARWDQAALEIGIDSFDDFLDMVEVFVESGKRITGGINEIALAKALNSNDPDIELFALKHDMLKNDFTAAEINKEITEFANREGIDLETVSPELISLEDITDVDKKQTILRELDKTFKKAKKKKIIEPEQKAISRAQVKAFEAKQPIFVFERQGRFVVNRKQPKKGKFIKITPPAAGEIRGKTERLIAGPTPEQVKEAKLLIQRINIVQKKKGLTKKEFADLKLEHGGSRRLTGTRPRTIEQLKAILDAVEKVRPRIIGHKTVVNRKTEKQIAELRDSLTDLGFMNDAEFQKVLNKEARGKEAKFVDARNFITQKEGREILNRMHDTAQRLRVTEPIRRAVGKDFQIKKEITKIEKLPTKAKDPSRLKSMRFVFQRLGEQANEPIYEVFLDLTLESQLRSRERHKSMKLAEKLPDFAKITNSPEALQRVEDWIVSQSVLFGRPELPKDITENELRLAKLIQASFKSYETLARAGKFFEFFDNRAELPQYLKFKQGIDKAFDVYNTKGYDALIEYLDTQDWGIVSAGYSPMESVVRKVSTHRMPDIAVGKTRIRTRGIHYRKQDRDILQRWYSYMRQMDQLVHIQPRIKSLVRLINDNQDSFVNARRISNIVSTYLDNLKHTNYEDGLIEEWSRRLYSQAITVRVLADPLKPLRNLAQNIAFSEDRRDFLNPLNKRLTAEDLKYLETHVHQSSVMMTDWAFVGEDPIVFKKLTKWVQRKTLYPASDRLNRLISFHAKINRVRRAFAKEQTLAEKMKDARFSDMQKTEQKAALGILAKDGVDAMARFVAKVHTDNTHFLYAREQRSPAEQTKLGRIALNLALFRRAALEKALFQLGKVFERKTGFGAKRRAASVLVTLLGMSAMIGVIWKKVTGQKYSPYSYFNFLELNFGGLEVAVIQKAEDAYNSMFDIFTMDPKRRGKAIESFGTNITKVADYMIPFYDLGLRAIEATIGSENIDRIPAKKLRELIDKEFKSRGLRQIDRSLIEKIQFTFAKGGKKQEKQEERIF